MEFLKLFLISNIIFLYIGIYTVCEYLKNNSAVSVKTHLPDYIIPNHYDIYLSQEVNKNFFLGKCNVIIIITRPTHNIYLHAKSPQIKLNSFVLHHKYLSLFYVPKNYTYNNESHIIDFYFNDELSSAFYILKMEFNTTLDNDENLLKTFYINKEGKRMWLIATHFQAIGARRLFPCWDEPRFGAVFNITIRHFSLYTALSNMPAQNIKTEGEMKLTYFEETPLISTYTIAIILLYPFEFQLPFYNTLINWYVMVLRMTPYVQFAADSVVKAMHYIKSEWKNFDASTLSHVVIPGFLHESSESGRLVFYREAAIIYDEKSDPFTCKINVARIITRAVIYQLVTNQVTPFQWSYAWINQGISSLLSLDVINKLYPESRMLDLFVVQIQQESLRLDNNDSIMKSLMSEANSPSEINSLFSFSYYIKAPAILRMLQYLLTNKVFLNGIKIFLNKPFANSDNLWKAMQTALDETFDIRKFDVKEMMNMWTHLRYYPVLEVTQHNHSYVRISLENYNSSNLLWIPIIRHQIISRNIKTLSLDSMRFEPSKHNKGNAYIPYDNNMIINFQQAGYYRVKYYDAHWLEISKRLNVEHTNVHVLNRAQIIDDAFYFLMKEEFNLTNFLILTEYLSKETDYIAWYPMIKALEYMSCFIPFVESTYIKVHLRNVLAMLLDKIGYTENLIDNELFKCLRQEIAKWSCILGERVCKKNALDKLEMHLNKSTENNLLPWWRKWTYCNGLMASDSNVTWWSVFDIWVKTSNNQLLEFLSCSVSPPIVRNYLNIIVNTSKTCIFHMSGCKDANIPVNERVNNFLLTIAKNAGNSVILKYILDNFDKIKPREVNSITLLIVIINHTYSKESLNQVTKFVENYVKNQQIICSECSMFLDFIHQKINNYGNTILEQITSFTLKKINIREFEIAQHKYVFRNLWIKKTKDSME